MRPSSWPSSLASRIRGGGGYLNKY
uniref:Uncharacterized protein n=1 Tax=Arundo donax TaxID=35708 RepID=A0A0A9B1Y4_ARUDO